MKGRSHRLPQSSAPPDDWGDGSWTVDCSCGVTFDDGEEMVSCDECGVWVHTRCSRFVKAEASFACHKCKAAAKRHAHHDTEETEVAQLLIELPTKTDTCPPMNPLPSGPAQRPPFRLWAEVPLEERVHVQGLPGGDPALFQGLSSSVFTSELWRCTGYVPKKFNFQYREFPCWNNDDDEGGENPASRGANLLFSLSKEIIPCVPVRAFDRRQSSPEGGVGKREGEKVLYGNRQQSWGKKERNKLRVFGSHSNKKRKDDPREGKDRIGKKKTRSDADRVAADNKKRGPLPIIDMSKVDFYEEGVLQIAESDVSGVKSEERKGDVLSELNSADHLEGMDNGSKSKHILVFKASKGGLSDEAQRKKGPLETPVKVERDSSEMPVKVEKIEQLEATCAGISSSIDRPGTSYREGSDVSKEPVNEEDVSNAVHGLKQPKDESHFEGDLNGGSCHVVIDLENSRPAIDNRTVPEMHVLPDSNGAISLGSRPVKNEVKVEGGDDQALENSKLLSCPLSDGHLQGMNFVPQNPQRSTGFSSKVLQEPQAVRSLPSNEDKSQDDGRAAEISYQDCDKTIKVMETEPKLHGPVVEESAGSSTGQEGSSEPRHNSKYVDDTTKLGEPNLCHSTANVQILVVQKASSASSAPVNSRLSVSGCYKSPTTTTSSTAGKTIHMTKQQRVKVTAATTGKKDTTSSFAEERARDVTRQTVKGHPKGSDGTGSRSSQMSRMSSTPASKHSMPDSEEQVPGQSKAATAENKGILASCSDAMAPSQTQNASVQIKHLASGSCQKSEKTSQPVSQPPSKLLNHPVSMHPPASVNAASTLSDEELALLLHQELNSSPRVHRVPRMRQAIGMQFASQTATSMLSKRSSYSGGRDQLSVCRKKNKEDATKDGSRNTRELIDETKRLGKLPSSPDRKHGEPALMADASAKKDAGSKSPDTSISMKKNIPGASTEGENNCPPSFEASGQSASSTRTSPRDVPDDETSPMARTLPGLIDEIMSKGKCLTYEDLCNAVRPHWHNLRKPNGERYAYSSHSHAVLDCLRNRSEWAHLIDRGPKTNSSKRRRKHDSDTATAEGSDTEEIAKNKSNSREIEDKNGDSHREEYPKGKRKARKRRRLELRGRGVKDARTRRSRRQGGAVVSDDDNATAAGFSQSSNDETDSLFSEDESHGTGQRRAGAEVFTSTSSGDDSD